MLSERCEACPFFLSMICKGETGSWDEKKCDKDPNQLIVVELGMTRREDGLCDVDVLLGGACKGTLVMTEAEFNGFCKVFLTHQNLTYHDTTDAPTIN